MANKELTKYVVVTSNEIYGMNMDVKLVETTSEDIEKILARLRKKYCKEYGFDESVLADSFDYFDGQVIANLYQEDIGCVQIRAFDVSKLKEAK